MPEWWENDGAGETRGSCQPLSNAAAVNCRENIRPPSMEASLEKILMDSGKKYLGGPPAVSVPAAALFNVNGPKHSSTVDLRHRSGGEGLCAVAVIFLALHPASHSARLLGRFGRTFFFRN